MYAWNGGALLYPLSTITSWIWCCFCCIWRMWSLHIHNIHSAVYCSAWVNRKNNFAAGKPRALCRKSSNGTKHASCKFKYSTPIYQVCSQWIADKGPVASLTVLHYYNIHCTIGQEEDEFLKFIWKKWRQAEWMGTRRRRWGWLKESL